MAPLVTLRPTVLIPLSRLVLRSTAPPHLNRVPHPMNGSHSPTFAIILGIIANTRPRLLGGVLLVPPHSNYVTGRSLQFPVSGGCATGT